MCVHLCVYVSVCVHLGQGVRGAYTYMCVYVCVCSLFMCASVVCVHACMCGQALIRILVTIICRDYSVVFLLSVGRAEVSLLN